jgi:hypothetical protein
VSFVKYHDINPAVVRPAFGSIVAADGHGRGKASYLEAVFVYAYVGKVVEYSQ